VQLFFATQHRASDEGISRKFGSLVALVVRYSKFVALEHRWGVLFKSLARLLTWSLGTTYLATWSTVGGYQSKVWLAGCPGRAVLQICSLGALFEGISRKFVSAVDLVVRYPIFGDL